MNARNDIHDFVTLRDLLPGPDHPGAGGPARLRWPAARCRDALGGGRAPGRGERRLLRPPGARQRPAAPSTPHWTLSPLPCSWMGPNVSTCSTRPAANATPAARAPRRPAIQQVRLGVQRILDAMTTIPAYLRNARLDILAANQLGRALFSPIFDSRPRPEDRPTPPGFLFLDAGAPEFYLDWERHADDTVAVLRSEAGRNLQDRARNAAARRVAGRAVPGRCQRGLARNRAIAAYWQAAAAQMQAWKTSW